MAEVIKFPSPQPRQPNIWDELSRRFYGADREYLKRVAYKLCYGGREDPWLDYMVRKELIDLLKIDRFRKGPFT